MKAKMSYKKQRQLQLCLPGIINGGDKSTYINNPKTSKSNYSDADFKSSTKKKNRLNWDMNSLSTMVVM